MDIFHRFFRSKRVRPFGPRHGGPQRPQDYWTRRSQHHYYQRVREWIDEFSPGRLIMDVGGRDTPIVEYGDFERRVRIDRSQVEIAGSRVEQVRANWFDYQCDEVADLVLCLQVLEHLRNDRVGPFARKLLESGRRIIISVPFCWPQGSCRGHLQDPVDLDKLVGWTGCPPVRSVVEDRDSKQRLITLFDGLA